MNDKVSSETNQLNGITIVGPYPPPIGGISMHIKRLKKELEDLGITCTVYDLGANRKKEDRVEPISFRSWIVSLITTRSSDSIVHFHGGSWIHRAIIALFYKFRKTRLIYTFHSLRIEDDDIGLLLRFCIKLVKFFGDYFIVVSPEIFNRLVGFGFSTKNMKIIPAYIAPKYNQKEFDMIPDYIWQFINSHSPIITANAYKISYFQGRDLYGIDMCIDLCDGLKKEFSNIGFVFCLPNIGDEEYFKKLEERIEKIGLRNNFLFVSEQIEYYPIISKANLFVRPTNTDGDAISIREAISLNTPVVCSDVIPRPRGVVLFRNRDTNDLLKKSKQILLNTRSMYLEDKDIEPNDLEVTYSDFAKDIYRIYQHLLQKET